MSTLVFNDTLGVYGGSQTLLYRISEWCCKNNVKIIILCEDDSNTEMVEKLKKLDVIIIVLDVRNLKEFARTLDRIGERELKIISFYWNHYFDVECVKKKTKVKIENLFYNIHPSSLDKGAEFRHPLFRKIAKEIYKRALYMMVNNNAFISMDELNIQSAERFYDISIFDQIPVIRLAYTCRPIEDFEHRIEKAYKSRTIMSASRAEYPYKGYMIGLIDIFAILKKDYPDLVLHIVSDGGDIKILEDQIEAAGEQIKKDIQLDYWMEYDALLEKLGECKLYIGMGTTILDAATYYKPCIPVKYNVMDCMADGLFSDNVNIGSSLDCEVQAINTIRKVLDMEKADYRKECIASRKQLDENYDIEVVMRQILSYKCNTTKPILKPWFSAIHKMNNAKNALIHKESKFKYSDIKHE